MDCDCYLLLMRIVYRRVLDVTSGLMNSFCRVVGELVVLVASIRDLGPTVLVVVACLGVIADGCGVELLVCVMAWGGSGPVTNSIIFCCFFATNCKKVFLRNTQSRFATNVFDGVLGLPCLARHTLWCPF